jgi:metallo-beta-lactamase class B
MNVRACIAGLALAVAMQSDGLANGQPHRLASDAVIDAAERAPLDPFAVSGRWNKPFAPFTVIGNIHYVGTEGVSAFLITTPKGHILIDGILAQSVPQIIANIRALGFDIRDVKFLLNSHAHIDHAGGLAGLQRASGAKMVASAGDRPTLEAGAIGFGPTKGMAFPPVRVDRVIADGGTVSLGGTTLIAHLTPGHTQGCTTWSMSVRGADGAPHTAVFHCSTTVAGQTLVPESWPGMVAAYRATFAKLRTMKADVLLAPHDNFFDLESRRARQIAGDANAFVDSGALGQLNDEMAKAFEAELERQKKLAG